MRAFSGIPIAIIIAVVLAIAAVTGTTLVVTGAVTLGQQKDPAEILLEAIGKSDAIKSYDIEYSLKDSIDSPAKSLSMNGAIRTVKSGNKSKVTYEINFLGASSKSDMYESPEGTVTCSSQAGNTTCSEFPIPPPVQSPAEQQEQLKKQLDEGVVSLSYTGQSSAAGRTCDSIQAVYDVPRLLQSFGQDTPGNDTIKSTSLNLCMDIETGLPLIMDFVMVVDVEGIEFTSRTSLTATSFSLSAEEIKIPEAAGQPQASPEFS